MRGTSRLFSLLAALAITTSTVLADNDGGVYIPDPPQPEPIEVYEIPLPPVAPSADEGACDWSVNPRGTGCMDLRSEVLSGNFLPDDVHVLATVNFTGAPAAPDPRSIYKDYQLLIIKSDGTTFSNGDPWKCITCGVPPERRNGTDILFSYAQAFWDGQRVLVHTSIVDGGADLASDDCTPETTNIYPIRLDKFANGTGTGAPIRELRLHPDQVHLGFNLFTTGSEGLGQKTFYSRLQFNANPEIGEPRSGRYDLVNVTDFYDPKRADKVRVKDGIMTIDNTAIQSGEFRTFSKRGEEIVYVGGSWEANNIDLSAADLNTGEVRRLTDKPGYVDPVDFSHDGKWMVIEDTRMYNRTFYIDGMRNVPPLIDLVVSGAAASIRNDGQRRFFQPVLLDQFGDRGDYGGQQINTQGDGGNGAVNDPQWNALADPKFSWDDTKIVYHQGLVISPACGGTVRPECPVSNAPNGSIWRIMVARLTSRTPNVYEPVPERTDYIPWGTPYVPGSQGHSAPSVPHGNYTLYGLSSGHANVSIGEDAVTVAYSDYSDDGKNWLNGYEAVSEERVSITRSRYHWYSNLTSCGESDTTKITSPDGYHIDIDVLSNIFTQNGTLVTTIDGVAYGPPVDSLGYAQ